MLLFPRRSPRQRQNRVEKEVQQGRLKTVALASFFFSEEPWQGRRPQKTAMEEVDRKEFCETEVGRKEVEGSEERDADLKYS